jgi:CRISPR-associated protein Csx3
VRSTNQRTNIIDVGGKISLENKIIMQEVTHAAILSRDTSQFERWESFCNSLNLKVITKIHSQLEAEKDEVFCPNNWNKTKELIGELPLLTGSVYRLQRGEDLSTRPMILTLADVLIYLTKY